MKNIVILLKYIMYHDLYIKPIYLKIKISFCEWDLTCKVLDLNYFLIYFYFFNQTEVSIRIGRIVHLYTPNLKLLLLILS